METYIFFFSTRMCFLASSSVSYILFLFNRMAPPDGILHVYISPIIPMIVIGVITQLFSTIYAVSPFFIVSHSQTIFIQLTAHLIFFINPFLKIQWRLIVLDNFQIFIRLSAFEFLYVPVMPKSQSRLLKSKGINIRSFLDLMIADTLLLPESW